MLDFRGWLFFLAVTAAPVIATGDASFTQIGLLRTTGISADGNVVVGDHVTQGASRYVRDTGVLLPLGLPLSSAYAVSANGDVVAGSVRHSLASGEGQAFRWVFAEGIDFLPNLPDADFARALAVSADGHVVVGYSPGSDWLGFRWTAESGMVSIGVFAPDGVSSEARGISEDGLVIVGGADACAFRWTQETGFVCLGVLDEANARSVANAVSADGRVVVGDSNVTGGTIATAGWEAFRWTEESGMIALGDLPGGSRASIARATSGDGSVVVGEAYAGGGPVPLVGTKTAFIWDAGHGLRRLQDVLEAQLGYSLPHHLQSATAISRDGRTIAGDMGTSGFVATLPEIGDQSAVLAALIGLTVLLRRSKRGHEASRACQRRHSLLEGSDAPYGPIAGAR